MRRYICSVIFFCVLFAPAAAAEPADEAIRAAVRAHMPEATEIRISATPLAGMREVAIGTQVLYASADGKYLVGGPLLDATSGTNLTERRVREARSRLLSGPAAVATFEWRAENPRHTLTVITDIDCPYCRKLHKEIPALNQAGVTVQYLMLPRAGRDSPSYDKTVGAACAPDVPAAITRAMLGADFARGNCENPIDQHMAITRQLGVTSTPMLVLPDGAMVAGFKSADAILALLGQ